MVTKFTHSKLFPGHPYPGPTRFDGTTPEPPILQLSDDGVIASLARMALNLLEPYQDELERLINLPETKRPAGIEWDKQPVGWARMDTYESVEYPPTLVGVLDGETLVKDHQYPVMVTYLGSDGTWYAWKTPRVGAYVPLKPNSLIVGHNVSYDTALIDGPVLGLDTQVLATQVSGFCTDQQWVSYGVPDHNKPIWAYKGFGKGNYKSLADTVAFYLKGKKLDKTVRNAFVEANTYEDLHLEWCILLEYCANDVKVTHQVLQVLWALWKAKAPNPISLWGAIVANSYRIPIAPDYGEWLAKTEEIYHQTQEDITTALKEIADEWVAAGQDLEDPWHSLVDWTVKPKTRVLKGYPEWYRKVKESRFTLKSVIGHYLLKIEYLGKPVRWTKKLGYHTDEGRIPHPEGDENDNVGYLFSQDFTPMFDSGALSSRDSRCQRLIELAYSTAYWQSVRTRALAVRVQNGWVVPQTGGGTVTGRVTEPLWLTTCDPKKGRIGSELKSRIQAPPGHKLVLADFASQEMRIMWLLADREVGEVGGTPMSQAGIAGDKALGTDCHSLLATHMTEVAGAKVPRDTAKTINYAMGYGAGFSKVGNNLRLECPHLSKEECVAIAKAAIEYKKGKQYWEDGERRYFGGTDSEAFNALMKIASVDRPRTPLLGREMPDPIMPRYVGKEYVTTRNNWVS